MQHENGKAGFLRNEGAQGTQSIPRPALVKLALSLDVPTPGTERGSVAG